MQQATFNETQADLKEAQVATILAIHKMTQSSNTGFNWAGAPIEGNLLDGITAFPTLQPGQSITFPVILSPVPYWLAGHKQFIKQGWKLEHFDDWNMLYQGALATINAGGTCKFDLPEGTGFTDKVVKGDSKQVGPLGDAWPNTCHPYDCS